MKKIKQLINKAILPMRLFFFNKKNNVIIRSSNASMKAKYGKYVRIEKGTFINDYCEINDYTYVNQKSYIENAKIGKFCSISSGVYIGPYEHQLSKLSTSPTIQEKNKMKGVVIGNDVLISLNCIILDGINIGDGAVIAAGAVVTHDVHPYEVVGGVPAKHIKYRFDNKIIKELEKEKWWDEEMDKIKKEYIAFGDRYENSDN